LSEDANDVTTFILVDKYRHFVYQHQLSSDNSVHIYQTTRCHVPKDAYSNEIIFDGFRLRTDVANVRGKSVQLSIVNANVQLSIVNAKKGTHQKYICEQGLIVYKTLRGFASLPRIGTFYGVKLGIRMSSGEYREIPNAADRAE
jgi:hypothetical protein